MVECKTLGLLGWIPSTAENQSINHTHKILFISQLKSQEIELQIIREVFILILNTFDFIHRSYVPRSLEMELWLRHLRIGQ